MQYNTTFELLDFDVCCTVSSPSTSSTSTFPFPFCFILFQVADTVMLVFDAQDQLQLPAYAELCLDCLTAQGLPTVTHTIMVCVWVGGWLGVWVGGWLGG